MADVLAMNAPFPDAKPHPPRPGQSRGEPSRPDIAILLDHFGSGGVERVACHLANGLRQRGFRVEVLALDNAGPVRGLLDIDIIVRNLRTSSSQPRADRLKAAAPVIASYLRK